MIVRLCGSGGAFEALPEKQLKLDLKKIGKKLEVVIETPVLVIVKDRFEVSIFRSGKLLIKNCKVLQDAEKQAEKIYAVLEKL